MVLGALGGAPGGIWAPRRPKAQKNSKIAPFRPPPREPDGPSGNPFCLLWAYCSIKNEFRNRTRVPTRFFNILGAIREGPTRNPLQPARSKRMSDHYSRTQKGLQNVSQKVPFWEPRSSLYSFLVAFVAKTGLENRCEKK